MVAIYHHAVTIGVLTCDIWLCYVHGRSYKVSVLQSTLVMVTGMSFSDGERKTEVKKADGYCLWFSSFVCFNRQHVMCCLLEK